MTAPVMVEDIRPFLAFLVPLVAVLGIVWAGEGRKNLRETFTFIAAALQASIVLSMVPAVLGGTCFEYNIWQVFTAFLFSCEWMDPAFFRLRRVHSVDRNHHVCNRLHAWFAGYARPVSTRFSQYPFRQRWGSRFSQLADHIFLLRDALRLDFPSRDPHAGQGSSNGRTDLFGVLLSVLCLLLPALSWSYVWLDGGQITMDFLGDGGKVGAFTQTTQMILLLLFTFGFAKAGIMPSHSWLPGAMVAPTPVSALLHAVAVVKVGVFCLYRVYADIFGFEVLRSLDGEDWLIGIACATILISSLIALSQDNLKRDWLSTIGQLGYVALGLPWPRTTGQWVRSCISRCMLAVRSLCSFAREPFSWPRAKNTSANFAGWAERCPLPWEPS